MNLQTLTYETVEGIAWVGFGKFEESSMTTLKKETLEELDKVVNDVALNASKLKGLIFFSHKSGCFLAGVDVHLIASLNTGFESAKGSELGQNIMNVIEDLPIPTLCCIDGVCLGGGFELALACKTILLSFSPRTFLGLPEVKLGLLPGFGGTYRLPRKVALASAMEMILTGKNIYPKEAKRTGLAIEVMAPERLLEKAPSYLGREVKKSFAGGLMDSLMRKNFLLRRFIFRKAREALLKKTKGFYQAPLKILDVLENANPSNRSQSLSLESQAFWELCVSEQSKNLQHVFFLADGSKKYHGPEASGTILSPKRGAVLGAGTMGGGIAWLFADNDQPPLMKDISKTALEAGLAQSSANFMPMVRKRRMSRDRFEHVQRSIVATTDYAGFMKADLVVEAVPENMELKKKIFAELENAVRPDCLVTSNTSSLSVTKMAEAFQHPGRFAGLHFFNPVNKMPLVEIIGHASTAPETIRALFEWCLTVKKTPVIVKDGPGFLVNRLLMPYLNEAMYLVEAGVPIQDVDQVALDFGMPMGPCRLLDEVGIDVSVKAAHIMHASLGERAKPSMLCEKLSEMKLLGRKNAKGFYLYDDKGVATSPNPEVVEMLPKNAAQISNTSIQMRLILPMINEAAIILDEGIVSRAADVDMGLIFGIGFPPFRGGLLKYADCEGLEKITEGLSTCAQEVSRERFEVSASLKKIVDAKKSFYEMYC